MNSFNARLTLPDHLPAGSEEEMKISTVCCANTFQRNDRWPWSLMMKLERFKTDKIPDLERDWDSKNPQSCFINRSSALRFELESCFIKFTYFVVLMIELHNCSALSRHDNNFTFLKGLKSQGDSSQ